MKTSIKSGLLLLMAYQVTITSPSFADENFSIGYDVYTGGMQVLESQYDIKANNGSYNMKLSAKTEGFLEKIFPWNVKYETDGKEYSDKLIHSRHTETSVRRNKTKSIVMDYDADGKFIRKSTTKYEKTIVDDKIPHELTDDATDILTGVTEMLLKNKNINDCNAKTNVFDGKRKYTIILRNEGKELIQANEYSSFSGEALKCTLTVDPVAGFKEQDKNSGWLGIQKYSEEVGKVPTIWIAKTKVSTMPIPVKMYVESTFGSSIAYINYK